MTGLRRSGDAFDEAGSFLRSILTRPCLRSRAQRTLVRGWTTRPGRGGAPGIPEPHQGETVTAAPRPKAVWLARRIASASTRAVTTAASRARIAAS